MLDRSLTAAEVLAMLPDPAKAYVRSQPTGSLAFSTQPYYSRVRLTPTITADGSNNTTYSFAAGTAVTPFQYGQGQQVSGVPASLTAYNAATAADTNIQTARQTNDGALVVIRGVKMHLGALNDPVMAMSLWLELTLTSGFGSNTNAYKHALPFMSPGASGLFGGGSTTGQAPNTYDTFGVMPGNLCNGMPLDSNVHLVDDQICWFPQAANSAESNFGMSLYLGRAVSYVSPGRAAGIIATGGTSGSIPAIVPAITAGARGTFVDIWVWLD